MALNLKYSTALKNAKLDAITTAVGNAALLRIYDGSQPAGPGTAIGSQVKLIEFVCGTPFAASASSGVLTAGAISSVTALASGTAAWFRLLTSGATAIMDGTVGTSGCDLTIQSTTVTSGQSVSVSSLTVTSAN
jgi:hypothetical protein